MPPHQPIPSANPISQSAIPISQSHQPRHQPIPSTNPISHAISHPITHPITHLSPPLPLALRPTLALRLPLTTSPTFSLVAPLAGTTSSKW